MQTSSISSVADPVVKGCRLQSHVSLRMGLERILALLADTPLLLEWAVVSISDLLRMAGSELDPEGSQSCLTCLSCRSRLEATGREVYRFRCTSCGREYFAVLSLVPATENPRSLEGSIKGDSDVVCDPRSARGRSSSE